MRQFVPDKWLAPSVTGFVWGLRLKKPGQIKFLHIGFPRICGLFRKSTRESWLLWRSKSCYSHFNKTWIVNTAFSNVRRLVSANCLRNALISAACNSSADVRLLPET
jgi:hypothetical protein